MEDGLRAWQLDRKFKGEEVLILVVVEDGLRDKIDELVEVLKHVLILVVVEDGLRVLSLLLLIIGFFCLNPCCCGRWSQRAKNAM